MREMIADLLAGYGFRVVQADSIEHAHTLSKEFPVGAFLVDVQIGGRNGLDFCRTIRQMDEYKVSPIIVITSIQERNILLDAFGAGCDDFIVKPIDGVVLLARLRAQLQRMEYFEECERTPRMLNRDRSTLNCQLPEAQTTPRETPGPAHT